MFYTYKARYHIKRGNRNNTGNRWRNKTFSAAKFDISLSNLFANCDRMKYFASGEIKYFFVESRRKCFLFGGEIRHFLIKGIQDLSTTCYVTHNATIQKISNTQSYIEPHSVNCVSQSVHYCSHSQFDYLES